MKKFDYVMYEGKVCILTEQRETNSTIAGIMMPNSGDYYFAFESDTNNENISECEMPISDKSIIYRLREWRKNHPDVFGFLDHELSLIHQFQ